MESAKRITVAISKRSTSKEAARSAVRDVISLFHIAAVDKRVLSGAIESPIKDFEDAVLVEAGTLEDVDAVVTRDPAGFQDGRLRVLSPQQLQAALG